jgi:hypothetical protein
MKRTATVLSNGTRVVGILSSRELREVLLTWQHPRDDTGEPLPLYPRDADSRPDAGPAEGIMPDFAGIPPEEMGVAVYETTTEGTPITPVFPATRDGLFRLLRYCAAHCFTFANEQTDLDTWAQLLGLDHVLAGREAS